LFLAVFAFENYDFDIVPCVDSHKYLQIKDLSICGIEFRVSYFVLEEEEGEP
jgi:hypothetical protein